MAALLDDYDRWPLWIPVLFGMGIALYFTCCAEPSIEIAYGGILFFLLTLFWVRLKIPRLFLLALGFVALGFSIASFRTHSLDTRMLHYPLRPLVLEGRVLRVELKPTQKGHFTQRLLLADLKADTKEVLPQKVRISLKGEKARLWPGQVIRLKAKLLPLFDPTLPGGFDFRRQAYFQGIGATGFSLSDPEILGEDPNLWTSLEKYREEITAYFLEKLPPPKGAIAAALITGDKSAIPENVREDFINSGLAHILAISGLHLTIIAGFVFMIIRRSIALIPPLCLRINSKKGAALGTLLLAGLYLIVAGFGIPAQRAFIMISLVMGGIFLDRSALSLRTVAFAAFLVLLVTPEALLGPSFQLSFAAVIALITGYEALKGPLATWLCGGGIFRKIIAYGGGLLFTSLLATLATFPFTIYFFHRFSLAGILANLVAVPLTSIMIMPSAFLSCLLAPLGLEGGALWIFDRSLRALIKIAETVSQWPGAQIEMWHPPLYAYLLVVFGCLWIALWKSAWRRWGVGLYILGAVGLFLERPPHILIDGRGKVAGVVENQTLTLSSTRKGKFTAETWRKHLAAKEVATLPCEDGICKTSLHGIPVIINSRKDKQPCEKDAVLISFEPLQEKCESTLLTIDWYDLWREGSHAIWLTSSGIQVQKTRPLQGKRPWSLKAIPRKLRPSAGMTKEERE